MLLEIPGQWWDAVTPGDLFAALLALAVVGGLLVGVGKAVRAVYPVVKKWSDVAELILGKKPEQGIPGQPSMVERFDAIDQRLASVEAQVTPNHGTSAHDQITRRIDEVAARLDATMAHLGIGPATGEGADA